MATLAAATTAPGATAQLPPPLTEEPKARVVFNADGGIHTIAADGSARRRLTTRGRDTFDEEPAWSPDGATIAFTRHDLGEESFAIWLVNRDGGGLRRLTAETAGGAAGPTWSPDGARLAFTAYDYDERRDRVTNSLVTVREDGTDRRVAHSETSRSVVLFTNAAWSPKGDEILFTRQELSGDVFGDNPPPEIRAAPAVGGAARSLVPGGDEAAWSPSGDRIAYSARHHRGSGRRCTMFCDGAGEIYVASADGSGRVRLTTSRADDGSPSWSGDGLRIAFQSDRNSTQAESEESPPELYSMRADGSCLTWLTNGTAHSESPDLERGGDLSSDPGGCGAVPREPLVETGMPAASKRPFTAWWLGRVAPNGLLLTHVGGDDHTQGFGYHDCGRFDPGDCGDFVNIDSMDLCATGGLRRAWRPDTTLSLVRGALLEELKDRRDGIGRSVVYTHRTRIVMDTASGFAVDRKLIRGLRRFPREEPDDARLPSTRLPRSVLRWTRRTTGISGTDAQRRRTVRKRLAQLGVKRRLGC